MEHSITKQHFALVGFGIGLLLMGSATRADCLHQAAVRHQVNPYVLKAIVQTESSNDPKAVNQKNTDNSTDYGLAQINSVHLPELAKLGISKSDLMNPCINIHVSAWLLARHIRRYGNTWDAIGAYHSKTEGKRQAYAARVYKNLNQHVLKVGETK